jgi:hypothetical protein
LPNPRENKIEIPIHAEVVCSDGPAGRSRLVIVNPTTKKVTNVVVKELRDPHTERLVPIRYVIDTDDDRVFLSCTRRDLSKMKEFYHTEFVRAEIPEYAECEHLVHAYVVRRMVATKSKSIPRGELEIRRAAWVRATNGKVGRVDEFVVEPASANITHLVMREGHLWDQREIAIPISAIDRIEEDTVFLNLDRSEVKALPAVPVKRWW